MDYHKSAQEAYMQQQRLLKQSEHDQLAAVAQSRQQSTPFYAPLLSKAGEALEELGQQLQQRYSTDSTIPSARSTQHPELAT